MTDIATLPTDILSHIASFIPTTSDLHNVRDTCKPLYHAAIPRLYRRMVLHETLDSDKLAGLLSPDNVGLQHIRHLEIVSACGDHHNKKERIDSMLTLLACMLPRNVLMTFTLDSSTAVSAKALATLHARQVALRTFRIDGSWRMPVDLSTTAKDFSHITCIHVEAYSAATVKICGKLLGHLTALSHLEVRADLKEYCKDVVYDLDEQDYASEKIVDAFFEHSLDVVKQPQKLRTLCLYDFDLSLAATKVARAVDCSRLHTLVLQKCAYAVKLLRRIRPTGLPARMNLSHLTVTTDLEDERHDDAIDDFLHSFSGLEHLIIRAPGQEALRPSTASIAFHAGTLRFLYLECMWADWPLDDPPEQAYYQSADLLDLLKQCPALEQLALDAPPLELDLEDGEIRKRRLPFFEALAAAPMLRTLRIPTVPEEDDLELDVQDDLGYRAFVKNAMQTYATQYVGNIPNLTALSLAHGALAEVRYGDLKVKPHFYGRGRVTDAYGRVQPMALEMPREQLRDIEPVSHILDVDLAGWRMLRSGYAP